jgi:hypothetical protein
MTLVDRRWIYRLFYNKHVHTITANLWDT